MRKERKKGNKRVGLPAIASHSPQSSIEGDFNQRLVIYAPQAKSDLPPVFVNKIILE